MPTIPLWLGLAAAVPPTWSPLQVYFVITLIVSLFGWTGSPAKSAAASSRSAARISLPPHASTAPASGA